jgi:hypothetical protein
MNGIADPKSVKLEKLREAIDHRIDEIQPHGVRYYLPGHEELTDLNDHMSSGYDNYIQYLPADIRKQLEHVRPEDQKPVRLWVDGVWTNGRKELNDEIERYEDNTLSSSVLVRVQFEITLIKGTQNIDVCVYKQHRFLNTTEKQQLLETVSPLRGTS